ncbi:MAG TPA: anthranilate phosphoribosyltransferase [Polyangiaceae bacterium]|nr:anthranilate phosphoribosyltransferase [Polyangiaceae bacterium]
MESQIVEFHDVFPSLTTEDGIAPQALERVFEAILAGAWTPAQIAGLLVALRLRGETPSQIAAAARALRRSMVPLRHRGGPVLDTCGTGGDGAGTVNLSTGAAIIAAAAGVRVAKHGNRAVSSRAGSADVVEALGIPLDLTPDQAAAVFDEAGITFLMAPVHHPAMRHAAPVRRELRVRTLFNLLGPLANPAGATHQLLGIYDEALRRPLALTLAELGTERAWVVRGADGLDEVSPLGPTRVTELYQGELRELEVRPEDFGLSPVARAAIAGGSGAENATTLTAVLKGEPHPSRPAFVLNAAAALVVATGAAPRDAAAQAERLLASGAAADQLERWRGATLRAGRED